MIDIDLEENPITEEEVVSILGTNYKKQGNELVWACPACRGSGNDKAGDNLKFNLDKHIIKCFACDFGQEITGIIVRRRYEKANGIQSDNDYHFERKAPANDAPPPPKVKEIAQKDLQTYYWSCHVALMQRRDILRKMFEKHTILPKTAEECMIGYDPIKDMLVFPSVAIGINPTDTSIENCTNNGAEYREYEGDKKVRRISGYDSKICKVWANIGNFIMAGIICEGYKDAYNLYQLFKMTDPEKLSYTAIFTVQNGTNSVNTDNCLQKINWKLYETMGVCFDNDHAGDEATEIATNLFSCIKDLRPTLLKGYNDIQKRFEMEFADQVDIDKAVNAEWIKDYDKEEILWKF